MTNAAGGNPLLKMITLRFEIEILELEFEILNFHFLFYKS